MSMKIRVDRNVPSTLYYTGDISIPNRKEDKYEFAISVFVQPSKYPDKCKWTLDDIIWEDSPSVLLVRKAEERVNSLITKIMEEKYE